jgi:hypothetical protein
VQVANQSGAQVEGHFSACREKAVAPGPRERAKPTWSTSKPSFETGSRFPTTDKRALYSDNHKANGQFLSGIAIRRLLNSVYTNFAHTITKSWQHRHEYQMPKIKSFAPSWLNEPSPGHKLFAQSSDDARLSMTLPYGKKPKPGPRRTIARRDTEVFVAVGKQIRWGDLAYLKESWETNHARSNSGTRIKRESSEDPFDHDNGIVGHGTDGYRVSGMRQGITRDMGANLSPWPRPLRRLSPTISASLSCPRTKTS